MIELAVVVSVKMTTSPSGGPTATRKGGRGSIATESGISVPSGRPRYCTSQPPGATR